MTDSAKTPPTGVGKIMVERIRQIEKYGIDHDNEHAEEELARAAACLATPVLYRRYEVMTSMWPWRPHEFQSLDRIDELVRAGALIAAEIDRLVRLKEKYGISVEEETTWE